MRGLKLRYQNRRSLAGFLFVTPWLIGVIGVFLRSIFSSMAYSVSNTTITSTGLQLEYIGFENFEKAFVSDPYFVKYLVSQIGYMFYSTPLILGFSLFIATILANKFRGRTAFRAIFFLPVVMGSGIILSIMSEDVLSQSVLSGARSSMLFESDSLRTMLLEAGIKRDIVDTFTKLTSDILNLVWKSGIQILLFVANLTSIPVQLYESAKVEGATSWECFWKITFPLISPVILLNMIYTIIDTFTDYSNSIMRYILDFGRALEFSYGSALSWIFLIAGLAVVALCYLVVNKWIVYSEE